MNIYKPLKHTWKCPQEDQIFLTTPVAPEQPSNRSFGWDINNLIIVPLFFLARATETKIAGLSQMGLSNKRSNRLKYPFGCPCNHLQHSQGPENQPPSLSLFHFPI
mmetsp:Transcript_36495/g.65272  ORF Transcript_36495/g.65272 Transcript_36495/m.65272 type:complete len:106 (-) Transcript_36495:36-353(-)